MFFIFLLTTDLNNIKLFAKGHDSAWCGHLTIPGAWKSSTKLATVDAMPATVKTCATPACKLLHSAYTRCTLVPATYHCNNNAMVAATVAPCIRRFIRCLLLYWAYTLFACVHRHSPLCSEHLNVEPTVLVLKYMPVAHTVWLLQLLSDYIANTVVESVNGFSSVPF